MLFITWQDWVADGRQRFGDNVADWAFICPVCGLRQTIRDFKKQSIPYGFAHVYHRCISFFEKGSLCGFGCSDHHPHKIEWVLPVIQKLHEVEVLHKNRYVPVFKFAKPVIAAQKTGDRSFQFEWMFRVPKRPIFPSPALTACVVPDHCGGWKIRDGHGRCYGRFSDKETAKNAIKENGWI